MPELMHLFCFGFPLFGLVNLKVLFFVDRTQFYAGAAAYGAVPFDDYCQPVQLWAFKAIVLGSRAKYAGDSILGPGNARNTIFAIGNLVRVVFPVHSVVGFYGRYFYD
ncbi:hypothetical protein K438DRAFT_1827254 [Mycena galopus ATCC 62051]|nr:hypothetical protein K438DRAFT_1827254 [Mycena galopus ATCC 62051]